MSAPRRETDIARSVVAYLRDLQWDVHQEVCAGGGCPRADIVAAQGPLLYVIEVKQSLSLAVIEQAMHWLDRAHYVSIAVPWVRRPVAGRGAARRICHQWGIGLLFVERRGDGEVDVDLKPRLGRTRVVPSFVQHLRGLLCEETRTWAEAGNAENRFWTPFRATCEEIRRVLAQRGPLTTRELMEGIRHHYRTDATARSTLPRWLKKGKIPGVTALPGRPLRWALTDTNTRGAA